MAIVIAVVCIGLQAAGLEDAWRYDRVAVSQGNYWLILSANFVHLGWSHLLLNMAGLILIVMLVWSNFNAVTWIAITLLSSLAVGLGLYWRDPSIGWYVGFSGTLHGLIIAGTLADIRRYPVGAIVLLVLVVGKLGWEQLYGAMPGSEAAAGGAVVVNSHLYGAIAGACCGIALLTVQRLWPTSASQA